MNYDLRIGVKNLKDCDFKVASNNKGEYEVNFRNRKYLITSDLNNCDCIAHNKLVDLAIYKNELFLHNKIEDDNKARAIESLKLFTLQCFCVDARLGFEKYKDKSKVLPVDLNDYDWMSLI